MSKRVPAALAVLIAVAAQATVVVKLSWEELAAHATLIVRGTVGQQQVRWDDERRRIHTYTELVVADTLKGPRASTVLVRQPGGELAGIGQYFSGTARFREGEDVIVFLEPAKDEPKV